MNVALQNKLIDWQNRQVPSLPENQPLRRGRKPLLRREQLRGGSTGRPGNANHDGQPIRSGVLSQPNGTSDLREEPDVVDAALQGKLRDLEQHWRPPVFRVLLDFSVEPGDEVVVREPVVNGAPRHGDVRGDAADGLRGLRVEPGFEICLLRARGPERGLGRAAAAFGEGATTVVARGGSQPTRRRAERHMNGPGK